MKKEKQVKDETLLMHVNEMKDFVKDLPQESKIVAEGFALPEDYDIQLFLQDLKKAKDTFLIFFTVNLVDIYDERIVQVNYNITKTDVGFDKANNVLVLTIQAGNEIFNPSITFVPTFH